MALHKTQNRVCVYCGEIGTTNDHVPPENLFPIPRPNDLITVPSCLRCNNGFSRDDEHFRTIIACDEESAGHPQAQRLWSGKILRQLHRAGGKGGGAAIPELIRQSFGSAANVTQAQVCASECRIARVLIRIVEALHYEETGERVPTGWEVRVNLSPDFTACDGLGGARRLFESTPGFCGRDIGDGVFSYRMVRLPNQEHAHAWFLQFFAKRAFLSSTGPRQA